MRHAHLQQHSGSNLLWLFKWPRLNGVYSRIAMNTAPTIKIRGLLELRASHGGQVAMDYLSLVAMLRYSVGIATTADLMAAWQVHQCNVSRRIKALVSAELIQMTAGHGAYQIHAFKPL